MNAKSTDRVKLVLAAIVILIFALLLPNLLNPPPPDGVKETQRLHKLQME